MNRMKLFLKLLLLLLCLISCSEDLGKTSANSHMDSSVLDTLVSDDTLSDPVEMIKPINSQIEEIPIVNLPAIIKTFQLKKAWKWETIDKKYFVTTGIDSSSKEILFEYYTLDKDNSWHLLGLHSEKILDGCQSVFDYEKISLKITNLISDSNQELWMKYPTNIDCESPCNVLLCFSAYGKSFGQKEINNSLDLSSFEKQGNEIKDMAKWILNQ